MIKNALNAIMFSDTTVFILEVCLHELVKSQLEEGLLVLKVDDKYLIIKECDVLDIEICKVSGKLDLGFLRIISHTWEDVVFYISKKHSLSDYQEHIGNIEWLTKIINESERKRINAYLLQKKSFDEFDLITSS